MDLGEKKELTGQRMLAGVVIITFLMILLCTIFTNGDVSTVGKLEAYKPDEIQHLDDGVTLLSFDIDVKSNNRSSLVFFTSHQFVDVFAKGDSIYRLSESGGIWGNTTGNVWNFVKVPAYAERIVVRLQPCYPEVAGQTEKYYVGAGNEIYTQILRQSMPSFIVSVFIVLVGIFITIYWLLVHKSGHIDGTLLYLGVFSVMLGLWAVNETNVAALILVNRRSTAFAAFLLLMVMPIPFMMFVKSFLEIKDEKGWKTICNINMLQIVISCVLNFTGVYEFRRSLWMTHIVIGILLIYMVCIIIYKIIKKQVDQRLRSCLAALSLVAVATVVDMGGYYRNGNNSGMFGRISFLVFIIVLGLEAARQTIANLKKGRRMEELEQFALNDNMTGLYNRNAYDFYVNNEENIQDTLIVTFDLNNLKRCNDNFGHSAGDAYISNSAHIIESNFERFGKCYRIGGDEFCCIIPNAVGFQIERFLQKLQQDVDILNNKKIIPTDVGIACGYAFVGADDSDIEKVRERADEMMYHNKKMQKGLI